MSKHSANQSAQLGYVKMFELNSPVLQRNLYLISRIGVPHSNATALLADHIRSHYQSSNNDSETL